MFNPRQENIGGRDLIVDVKYNHYKALRQIKPTIKLERAASAPKSQSHSLTKHQKYELHEHMRNLINLNTKLENVNNWSNLRKHTLDYIVNPVLFFRPVKKQKPVSKVSAKKHTAKRIVYNSGSLNNQETKLQKKTAKLSKQELSRMLPKLQSFKPIDLKQYADSLVNIIMKWHISTPQKLNELHTAVIETIPSHYPSNFEQIVQKIIEEVYKQMFHSG